MRPGTPPPTDDRGDDTTRDLTVTLRRRARLRIDAAAVDLLYRGAPAGIGAGAVVALMVGLVEAAVVEPLLVWGWVALMESVSAGRAGLCIAYHRAAPAPARAPQWGRAFTAATALSGIGWGIGAAALFPPGDAPHRLFLALTYGGMAAGGVAVLAAGRGTVAALLVPMLVPLAGRFLLLGDDLSVAVAGLILLCLAAMLVTGRRNHETIVASLRLREENSILVERLRRKERTMAATNRRLEEEVAERRRRETELEETIRAAEEASRVKSQFLANISHEIRTPMNGVLGMTELLLKGDLTPRQRHYADTAHRSGRALLALINNILDFSKNEAGQLHLEAVDFPLVRTIEEAVDLFQEAARAKGIALRCRFDDTLPEVVRGDPTRLRQLLTNLVGNALKFTEYGRVAVTATAEEDGDDFRLRVAVRDTGIGIDPAAQTRIFAAFSQADGSTTRRYGGTGLGLAICKQITELMGGEIGVESRPGEGSTFWFTARLAPPLGDTAGEAKAPAAPTIVSQRAGRILVAEDNPVNQEVVKAMLESRGHRVVVVDDGKAAVAAVAEGDFDLCLMDCQMPEMDGIEATAAIRTAETDGTHLPIIALTAHAIAGDRERCLAAAMDDYLSKPFTEAALARMVGRWLAPGDGGEEPLPTPEAEPAAPSAPAGEGGRSPIDQAALGPIRTLEASGRPGLLAKVVALYLDDAAKHLAALHDAVGDGDTEAIRTAAHALKSGSANVGATSLAALCKELERLGRDGCLAPMAKLTTEIDAAYHLVSRALAAEVDSHAP